MPREDQKVYVGNLPSNVGRMEVLEIFRKYGPIKYIDLKFPRGSAYAFVVFKYQKDAESAVRGRDNYSFDGRHIRVETIHGAGPRGPGGHPLYERGRDNYGGAPRRSGFRVFVDGLPSTAWWPDLKEHMRKAGAISYANVTRGGTGFVDFFRREDAKYAIRKLDDTKLRSRQGDSAYIRVRENPSSRFGAGRSHDRSRSRSGRRPSKKHSSRRSPSRSRSRSRSTSRSSSSSPSRSSSRSSSQSPSRSPRRSPSRSPRRRR